VNVLQGLGWERGQTVGKVPRERRDERPRFSAADQAELFLNLASTLGARGIELEARIKRDATREMKPIAFQAAEAAGAYRYEPATRVTWHQLAHAMVRMTAHSFSADGQVHVYDSGTSRWTQHRFRWTGIHRLLADAGTLPADLEEGMRKAQNGEAWTRAMQSLLEWPPSDWDCVGTESGVQRRGFLTHVGTLWHNLASAMNAAAMNVAFCSFFCAKVMDAMNEENCGAMSFTLTLSRNSGLSSTGHALAPAQYFTGKVRYRPQGRDPETRYHNRATHSQRSRLLLDRPLQAARGILPPQQERRRRQ